MLFHLFHTRPLIVHSGLFAAVNKSAGYEGSDEVGCILVNRIKGVAHQVVGALR
jgi:hypothetical protein